MKTTNPGLCVPTYHEGLAPLYGPHGAPLACKEAPRFGVDWVGGVARNVERRDFGGVCRA
jgi:hypothetical protein